MSKKKLKENKESSFDGKSSPPRRQFIKSALGSLLGLGSCRFTMNYLMQHIANSIVQKAYAQDNPVSARRFVYFQLYGAPPAYHFDHILNPMNDPNFVMPSGFANYYTGNTTGYSNSTYKTVIQKGMNVPYMWSLNVPKTGGGTRPVSDLLDHFVNIQGIQLLNASHTGNANTFLQRPGDSVSVNGYAADNQEYVLPSVSGQTSNLAFQSKKGSSLSNFKYGSTSASGPNPLSELLNPIHPTSPPTSFREKNELLEKAIESAISAIGSSRAPHAVSSSQDQRRAKEVMKMTLEDLSAIFVESYNRYFDLISRAIQTQNIVGINDLPVGVGNYSNRKDNLRYLFAQNVTCSNADIRSLINTKTTIEFLANQFAVAEYLLTRNFTGSIAIGLNNIGLSQLSLLSNGSSTLSQNSKNTNDQHYLGTMVSPLVNTFFYLPIAACLLEFIDRLKLFSDKSIFNDTVICMAREFNRMPLANGRGSDHAHLAQSLTFFTGLTQQPLVLGHISKQSETASIAKTYPGTWGDGAPVPRLPNGRPATLADIQATIAALLGLPKISQVSDPLVTVSNGQIVSQIGEHKIVDNGGGS